MTAEEIKSEIQKSLDKVPESILGDILEFLRLAEKQPAIKISLTLILREILSEAKELLERLAN